MKFWSILFGYATVDFLATWASARWIRGDGRVWMSISCLCYFGCSILWLWALGQKDAPTCTRALAIYPIVAMLTGVTTAWLIVGDKLGPRDWVGVALGLAAVIILATSGKGE